MRREHVTTEHGGECREGSSRNGSGPQQRSQLAIMPLLAMSTARVSPAEPCKPGCKPRVDPSEKKKGKIRECKSNRPVKTGAKREAAWKTERERAGPEGRETGGVEGRARWESERERGWRRCRMREGRNRRKRSKIYRISLTSVRGL